MNFIKTEIGCKTEAPYVLCLQDVHLADVWVEQKRGFIQDGDKAESDEDFVKHLLEVHAGFCVKPSCRVVPHKSDRLDLDAVAEYILQSTMVLDAMSSSDVQSNNSEDDDIPIENDDSSLSTLGFTHDDQRVGKQQSGILSDSASTPNRLYSQKTANEETTKMVGNMPCRNCDTDGQSASDRLSDLCRLNKSSCSVATQTEDNSVAKAIIPQSKVSQVEAPKVHMTHVKLEPVSPTKSQKSHDNNSYMIVETKTEEVVDDHIKMMADEQADTEEERQMDEEDSEDDEEEQVEDRHHNRIVRSCPICKLRTNAISKHLDRIHKLTGAERWKYIYRARAKTPICRKETKTVHPRADCSLCPAKSLTNLRDHMRRKHSTTPLNEQAKTEEEQKMVEEEDEEDEEKKKVEDEGTGTENSKQKGKSSDRRRNRIVRSCPICQLRTNAISKHLDRIHKLTGAERWKYIYRARAKTPICRKETKTVHPRADCSLCPAKGLTNLRDHMRRKHSTTTQNRQALPIHDT